LKTADNELLYSIEEDGGGGGGRRWWWWWLTLSLTAMNEGHRLKKSHSRKPLKKQNGMLQDNINMPCSKQ
jgi:hypothetical protein